ncbi:hypothetical protein AVBRAN12654_03090 [Campylobacter sp. RM12654]|uniref:hypothetical protein n=1 Tax=unclassified Campylobacter TaxID=2593542 RepID=UPI001BD9757A|nr:hypothetical protein [Campylobacter sp. 2018MI01]MBT0879254.1 hypothetical protein [Campylobacter sp. 2018MI01]MBZ7977764.1 hypothetical protein [Campylobacter sp. RM12654]
MANFEKNLTRQQIAFIRRARAEAKARAWLIDKNGLCTHIPKNMALVPYKEKNEKATKEKEILGVTNNPNLQFLLGIGFITILYLIGCYLNNLERTEFLNSALEVIAR